MVEATSDTLSAERKAEIADSIFWRIDEQIRESKDWSKDLVLEISERYENLARENLRISQQKLDEVRLHLREIPQMYKQGAPPEQMKDRILSILSTEDNQDPFLVGEESDFLREDGRIKLHRVQKALRESVQVVEDRCLGLKMRLDDPDVTAAIQRKVIRPC